MNLPADINTTRITERTTAALEAVAALAEGSRAINSALDFQFDSMSAALEVKRLENVALATRASALDDIAQIAGCPGSAPWSTEAVTGAVSVLTQCRTQAERCSGLIGITLRWLCTYARVQGPVTVEMLEAVARALCEARGQEDVSLVPLSEDDLTIAAAGGLVFPDVPGLVPVLGDGGIL